MPGAPHPQCNGGPQRSAGPAGPGNLPREECAQRRGNLLGRPVVANKPEAHRPQGACAVPAPGFTANTRPRERTCPRRKGRTAQACPPQQQRSGMESAAPHFKPVDHRTSQDAPPHRCGRPESCRCGKSQHAVRLSVNCRRLGGICLPTSRTACPSQARAVQAVARPRTAQAGRHACKLGQRPLESRSQSARGTPAARVAPMEWPKNRRKPRPKPGHMLKRQLALLRRLQAPRLLHRCRPARPAPPPRRWEVPRS